jgi:phage FluMu protein Com
MPIRETSVLPEVRPLPGVSGAPERKVTVEELEAFDAAQKLKAKYKIEIIFSRHRSTLAHKPSPIMLLIWESGKRFHGGGDQKMYWCGYQDCGKPLSSDNFAYMHVVCPKCKREQFLDPDAKATHAKSVERSGGDSRGILRMPLVVGEKLANLIPAKLSELLEKTWRDLDGDADIYLKYSPFEIRYDSKHETVADLDRLDKVRVQRQPLIYPLKNIIKDMSAGADLRTRLLAMITS